MTKVALYIAMMILLCGGPVVASERTVTFCNLATNITAYAGQQIETSLRVITDGRHGAVVTNDECTEKNLKLIIRVDTRSNADIAELRTAMRSGGLGTAGKVLTATVVGHVLIDSDGSRSLVIEQAKDIKVKDEP